MEKTQLKTKVSNFFDTVKSELVTTHSDFKNIIIKCLVLFACAFLSLINYYFVILTIAAAALFIIFEKSARCVYYMIFLLPFLNILRKTTADLYYSIALWCLVLLILGIKLIISFFIKKDKKINWPLTISVAVFLIYILLVGPINFTNHGAALLTIAVLYVLYYYHKEFGFKEILFIFFLGVSLAGVSGLFRTCFARAEEMIPLFWDNGIRFTGVSNDPNYYAGDLAILLAGFMILYLKKDIKYIFYPAMVILTIFALKSLSKMMLLIYCLTLTVFCVYVLIKYRWKKGFVKCLAITGAFVLSALICFNQILSISGRINRDSTGVKQEITIPSDTPTDQSGKIDEDLTDEYYVYEFRNNALTVLTTGRTNIWLAYIEESFSSVKFALFGHGVGAPFILCDNGYKIGYLAEHNTFVQMIYRLGIVGSLLLLACILCAIKKETIKKLKLENIFVGIVLLGLFMALCNLLSYRLSIYLTILFLSLTYSGFKKEEEPKFVENLPSPLTSGGKDEKELSVIIPVKNGEKYIENCINSVIYNSGLTNGQLEVIVVNDGSTDNTKQVVNAIINQNSSVKLIDSEGVGVSEARNAGICAATGKFLAFLDADDVVDSNFKMALNEIKRHKADLYQFAFVYDINSKLDQKNNYKNNLCGKVHTKQDKHFKKLCLNYYNGVWNKLVRREFIIKNNLCFKKYAVAEDMEWGVRVLLAAESVYASSLAYYHYIKYPTSVMGTASLSKTTDAINACYESFLVIKNANVNKKIKSALTKFVSKTAYSTLQFYKKLAKEDKKKFLEFLQDKQDLFVVTNKPKFVIIKASLIALGLTPTVILLSKI